MIGGYILQLRADVHAESSSTQEATPILWNKSHLENYMKNTQKVHNHDTAIHIEKLLHMEK